MALKCIILLWVVKLVLKKTKRPPLSFFDLSMTLWQMTRILFDFLMVSVWKLLHDYKFSSANCSFDLIHNSYGLNDRIQGCDGENKSNTLWSLKKKALHIQEGNPDLAYQIKFIILNCPGEKEIGKTERLLPKVVCGDQETRDALQLEAQTFSNSCQTSL